ncbi:MAG: PPC domain-containing protein [Deltaproteobacteria bacterium]|nr:PPC domain-containing protein [Deltaproteobacteria bacterium]
MRPLVSSLLTCCLLWGCGSLAEVDQPAQGALGKADNFYSNAAQEFLAEATFSILLPPTYASRSFAERQARAAALARGKTLQFGWFLHLYLIDKDAAFHAATHYGGLRAMVLDGSQLIEGLRADPNDPLRFEFAARYQVGGISDLIKRLAAQNPSAQTVGDHTTFSLQMVKLSQTKLASLDADTLRHTYVSGDWSPADCKAGCQLESVDVSLRPQSNSADAYPDYKRLFGDRVIDIALHFGWDYNRRADLQEAREFYHWLTAELGFSSPALDYESYNRLSGPLTKSLRIAGQTVSARVSLFRPDPCVDFSEAGPGGAWESAVSADPHFYENVVCKDYAWSDANARSNPTTVAGARRMRQDLERSLTTRDVVIYSGHSGYGYAYAMASWYRTQQGEIGPAQLRTLALPKDRSQIFVLAGCETYAVAQAFRDNPAKKGLTNLDVLTTTRFSSSPVEPIKELLRALVGDESGWLRARSYGELMRVFNPLVDDSRFDRLYDPFALWGVHGIDDNPRLNPYAYPGGVCKSCATHADCGAAGNVCAVLNEGESVCLVSCVSDAQCVSGYSCQPYASGSVLGSACLPDDNSCAASPPRFVPGPEQVVVVDPVDVRRGATASVQLDVGRSARDVRVIVSAADGDVDLYARFGAAPTQFIYDCRPFLEGSSERCSFPRALDDTIHVQVVGRRDAKQVEIKLLWR